MTDFSKLSTYSPSGHVSWRFPVSMCLLGLPFLATLAWLYAHALLLSPPVLLKPIIAVFFLLACAVFVPWAIEKGHSRSIAASTIAAILLSLAFMWIHWLVIFGGLESGEAMRFALSSPWGGLHMLWELAVAESKANPRMLSPVVRCMVWVAEAGLFALFMVFFSRLQTRKPYSETAGCWATEEKLGECVLFYEATNKELLLKKLAAQRIGALLGMVPADRMQPNFVASEWFTVKLTGYKAEGNAQERWLDVEWLSHQRDSEGKIKTRSSELLKAWILTHEEYAALAKHMGTESPSSETTEKPTPRELRPAVEALEAGDFGKAIAMAEPYRKHSEIPVRMDALRLCALGKSRQKQWVEAYAAFHELFELEPNVHNAMELATTSVMAGELLRGEAWFKRAEELNVEFRDTPPPQLRTRFLSALEQANELAAAKPHVDWLAEGYRALAITDSHFVFTRGFPFFGVFLEKSLPILQASCSEAEIRTWYEKLREGVDEEGKTAVDALLKAAFGH